MPRPLWSYLLPSVWAELISLRTTLHPPVALCRISTGRGDGWICIHCRQFAHGKEVSHTPDCPVQQDLGALAAWRRLTALHSAS